MFNDRLQHSNVIMVSHSMNTLRQFCQAGLVLELGKVQYFEDIEVAIEMHMENMRRDAA